MAEIVDPVIQNGKSFQQSARDSGVSINRTAPLPSQSANSGSQRRENMSLRRSNSQTGMNERYGAAARGERNGRANGKSSMRQTEEKSRNQGSRNGSGDSGTPAGAYRNGDGNGNGSKVMDFFSPEVFQIVLHNPTTAHRFKKFCQSRACGENMEFLEKVDTYIRLLDQLAQLLSSIQSNYISPDATHQINIPSQLIRHISADVKTATQNTIPGLECIFDDAQDHIQKLLASDIYHRFVKHQVTTSATLALTEDRERFEGLGDCFCLTDTAIADNPIVFASDGFVSVTGYSRHDIIPRNCRFLQGAETDPLSPKRLRKAIFNGEETVELLLNYRKNGDPFWNLLYVTPLYDEHGVIRYFLGGQINVSTTVHSYTDVLKVLGQNSDDDFGDRESIRSGHGPEPRRSSVGQIQQNNKKPRSSFFRNFRSYARSTSPQASVPVREEAGMENELVNRMSKLNFTTQVEAFYTAYSKYIIMTYTESSRSDAVLSISFFSPGVIDMLCLNLPNGSIAPIYHKEIFKVLAEHSSSSSITKAFKQTVRDNLSRGKAISVELGLMTGYAEASGGFGGIGKSKNGYKRIEERYVSHWTPMKNEHGEVGWVALTIAPK